MQLTGVILRDINRIAEYLNSFLDKLKESGAYDIADKPGVYVETIGRDMNPDKSGIFITLLHIEEETSMKQQMPVATRSFSKDKPEMMVNMYVMFSAQDSSYDHALQNISWVLQAFQSATVIPGDNETKEMVTEVEHLSLKNDGTRRTSDDNLEEKLDIEATKEDEKESLLKVSYEKEALRMSIHQMTLDQMTNLWQSLGAKMMPAVIYKVRMLTIKSNEIVPISAIRKGSIKTRIEQARSEEMAAVKLIEEEEKRKILEDEKAAEREKVKK